MLFFKQIREVNVAKLNGNTANVHLNVLRFMIANYFRKNKIKHLNVRSCLSRFHLDYILHDKMANVLK